MKELLSSLGEKITQFIEIIVVLFLDFGITFALWYLKVETDKLAGFSQMQEQDDAFRLLMKVSSYGLYAVLSLFIIGDILRQALKTYIQVRKQLKEINADV